MKLLAEGKIKKLSILVGFLFLLFGLFAPWQFVQAQGGFIGAIMSIPINIISILLQVTLIVSNLVVGIAGFLLNWVLSPYFTSLPYTHGGIVDVGWPIVRDFINMFFIIALVIIGLATALRIKEYQAHKTLPSLIIIAVLINFTPVICGLIIDASNIVMNFFLEYVTGFKMMGNFFAQQGGMLSSLFSTHFFDLSNAANVLGKTIAMIAFDWMAALIFIMYAGLFIMRYIMIWVLVIVSPIAFFSRIFSGDQKYIFKSILGWDEWWKQFIEWSLIGVIGAFFLYLGEQLLVHMPPQITSGATSDLAWGFITVPVVELINNLLPYGVVIAFLFIGFMVAISSSAMGAGAIIKAAKRGEKTMRKPLSEAIGRGFKFPGRGIKEIGKGAWQGIRHPLKTGAGIAKYARRIPTTIKETPEYVRKAGEAIKTKDFWKQKADVAGKGLKKAWTETGGSIAGTTWEASKNEFIKEIFGKKPGGKPDLPKKEPDESDEAFAARLETYEENMEAYNKIQGKPSIIKKPGGTTRESQKYPRKLTSAAGKLKKWLVDNGIEENMFGAIEKNTFSSVTDYETLHTKFDNEFDTWKKQQRETINPEKEADIKRELLGAKTKTKSSKQEPSQQVSEEEKQKFQSIAKGEKTISEEGDLKNVLRDLRGAIRELSNLTQQQQTTLRDKTKEIDDEKTNPDPIDSIHVLKLHDLEEEGEKIRSKVNEYQDRDSELNNKLDEIKKKLTNEITIKARKGK